MNLIGRALRRRRARMEIGAEAIDVRIEQRPYALLARRGDDQSGVMPLADARDDLAVRVAGHVGMFLTRERQHDARVQAPWLCWRPGPVPAGPPRAPPPA